MVVYHNPSIEICMVEMWAWARRLVHVAGGPGGQPGLNDLKHRCKFQSGASTTLLAINSGGLPLHSG